MPTITKTAINKPSSQSWVEVDTVFHSYDTGKEAKIVIVQNETSRQYSAIVTKKQGKRWVSCEDFEITPNSDWSDVLDQAIAKISESKELSHHGNKPWVVVRKLA